MDVEKNNTLPRGVAYDDEPPIVICGEESQMMSDEEIIGELYEEEKSHFFDSLENKQECYPGVTYDYYRGVTYDEDPEENIFGNKREEMLEAKNGTNNQIQRPETTPVLKNPFNSIAEQFMSAVTELVGTKKIIVSEDELEEIDAPIGINFSPKLRRHRFYVYDTATGEQIKHEYVIDVTVHKLNGQNQTYPGTVESSKVKGYEWLKICTHGMAKIPSKKEEKAMWESRIQACIETENVPTEIIYQTPGWRNVKGIGYRYVYADGMVGEKNPLVHTAGTQNTLDVKEDVLGSQKVFNDILKMGGICRNVYSSAELLLFVHTAVLSSLYELAGYPVNFLFGVIGITNSRKTSMVTAMAQIFDRQKLKAHAEFATSTSCGVEKILGMYRDGVVVVDDFKPGVNPAQSRLMTQKLDELVRLTGNRVAKSRMTDFMQDGDKKYFPITSTCAVTMELVQGVTSTLSRMFLTEIDGTSVDNELLAYYQQEKWILPTHLYDFIAWITGRFMTICEYIQNRFGELRKCHKFAFGRYDDMFATLVTTAEIIGHYAQARGFWNENDVTEFLNKTELMLVYELNLMGERAQQRDKSDVVKRALQDAFLRGKIGPRPLTPDTAALKEDVYEDQHFVYARTDYIRGIVNDFCRDNFEIFRVDGNDEIIDLLEKINLLDIRNTNRGRERARKLPKQKDNHLRYLFIKRDEIEELFIE